VGARYQPIQTQLTRWKQFIKNNWKIKIIKQQLPPSLGDEQNQNWHPTHQRDGMLGPPQADI
jgi:hypothetical protein